MREIMIFWLTRHVGQVYRWGGNNGITGYDCSGLAQEFLLSFGAHPQVGTDMTAQVLYDSLKPKSKENIFDSGSLVFFGKNVKAITHVGILINDSLMVEAGGGGSKTLTQQDAINQNAFVRIRPLSNRKDLVGVLLADAIFKLL